MPDIASATDAYAGQSRYGESPVLPKPEIDTYTARGYRSEIVS